MENSEIVNNTEKKEKIIKDFLQEMKDQDNRHTAFPYFYVIRTEEWQVTDEHGCNSGESGVGQHYKTVWVYNDDGHSEYSSREELEEEIKDIVFEDFEEDLSFNYSDFEEYFNDYIEDNYTEYELIRVWKHKGMFLTEKDADLHLKKNHYHYSDNAHTFVDHAWRAEYLKEFFESLFDYFKIEKGE